MQTGYDIYQQNKVNTNTQGNLIVMLYEGAIRFINIAIDANSRNDYEIVNRNLIKAQRIFEELTVTLNFEVEMAANLEQMYEYFNYELIQANLKKDSERMINIKEMIEEILDGWKQIVN